MVIKNINFEKYNKVADKTFYRKLGKVVNVVGLTIESAGPDSKLGDLCRILPETEGTKPIMAEVVGFRDKKTLLMPYDSVDGIGLGCVVENTDAPLKVTVSDKLLGKTVNGLGIPIDGEIINGAAYPVEAAPPDPMSREIIDQVLPLGVKAVDGMITVGKGQRIGIFAGSGVGKSTLMGMFARNTKADINVIALIGERGREVREFIERDLGEEGMRRSVVVVATSDRPALERNKAAKTATAIAEYFRDQGKDVLLMMDSLTRFAMAQREIGLAVGEPTQTMYDIIDAVEPHMPREKPRYLMGVGTPSNIIEGVARGIDFFDCVMPARNARHGKLFTWEGTINIKNEKYKLDDRPIDPACTCPTCAAFSRAYVRHLLAAGEMLAMRLAVMHNLHFYNELMARIRQALDEGRFEAFRAEYSEKLGRPAP